ncbi:MAG: ArsI/CadI family heavy metal resistance metalloenzyme [Burkholderiales bacterium]|jgi:catechol 2,3-dioxygenase-like lactoylglutathione lyase family enzyme
MKRFHVHVSVDDLANNIRFYSSLFGSEPSVVKDDYAKWMLDDPKVNFAISRRGDNPGVNHLGIQVESDEELEIMRGQLTRADQPIVEQVGAACCYAKSNKHWVQDPQGVAWETFHSLSSIPVFGRDTQSAGKTIPVKAACCVPKTA